MRFQTEARCACGVNGSHTRALNQSDAELKRTFWAGTDHWAELLPERARMSGKLVLSDYTKKAIEAFRARG